MLKMPHQGCQVRLQGRPRPQAVGSLALGWAWETRSPASCLRSAFRGPQPFSLRRTLCWQVLLSSASSSSQGPDWPYITVYLLVGRMAV